MDVHAFASAKSAPNEHRVDILHLSPPCKFFSPCKTLRGCVNDDANEAALFCIDAMLKKCRPRIITLEQTFGLIERFPQHFNALIHQFIANGFSISWQVMSFQNRGLAQSRRRLIIVAAW
jgi:DNA (cytosine-5)-methyltransferase 1